ncbi:MAG: prolipoprotein diacylglyceryl transferase family protein [bacterium]
MFPELIRIGDWPLRSFGVLYTIAFTAGFLWTLHRSERYGISLSRICTATFLVMLSFALGCRIYFVLCHWQEYRDDWAQAFAFMQRGSAQYGGVFLSIFALVLYARLRRMSCADLAATFAPPVFLTMAISRVGCFANGCCFGLPTSSCLGVHYPEGSHAFRAGNELLSAETGGQVGHLATANAPAMHPSQLYASVGALVCLGVLLWIERRGSRSINLAGLSLVLLGALRFTVDRFRYYEESATLLGLPINTWLSLILVLGGMVVLWRGKATSRSA